MYCISIGISALPAVISRYDQIFYLKKKRRDRRKKIPMNVAPMSR